MVIHASLALTRGEGFNIQQLGGNVSSLHHNMKQQHQRLQGHHGDKIDHDGLECQLALPTINAAIICPIHQ